LVFLLLQYTNPNKKAIILDSIIPNRRPEAWSRLSQSDTALLDFLRCGGRNR
jgi:hypothetical protein